MSRRRRLLTAEELDECESWLEQEDSLSKETQLQLVAQARRAIELESSLKATVQETWTLGTALCAERDKVRVLREALSIVVEYTTQGVDLPDDRFDQCVEALAATE